MEAKIIEHIRQAQRGDQRAFQALVALYDDRVSNLIYSIVLNRQDTEDLYQEVFLKVWKKIKTFQFRSDFYSWLYRITVNTCYNFTKRRARNQTDGDDEIMNNIIYPSEENDPNKLETTKALYGAIQQLSPRLRTITVMHYLEGNTINNISIILRIGEGTIKKYLFRAREILRKELAGYA
ncbi:MAG: RNA polymerase sigma factor [Candidatus Marinimicrobia bacterium]|nr:RNA polymerase sigma factor [Candidatus Neomarinimicrobiota bacterium]